MLYLGIDQHRKQLTVNLRNEEGEVVLKRQVSTEWGRVRKFFEELEQQAELEGGFMAIVELCGFNDWRLQRLAAANAGLVRVPRNRVDSAGEEVQEKDRPARCECVERHPLDKSASSGRRGESPGAEAYRSAAS